MSPVICSMTGPSRTHLPFISCFNIFLCFVLQFHNLLVRLESQMYIEPTINQQAKQIIETHWQWLQENEKLLNEWFEFHNSDGHQPDGGNNPSSAYVAGPMISLLVSLIILLILE